jgi:hypothetical protein
MKCQPCPWYAVTLPFPLFLRGCGSARRASCLSVRIALIATSLAASANARSIQDMGNGSLVFPGQDGRGSDGSFGKMEPYGGDAPARGEVLPPAHCDSLASLAVPFLQTM